MQKEIADILAVLYRVDERIYELNEFINVEAPESIKDIDRKIADLEDSYRLKEQELKDLNVKCKDIEIEQLKLDEQLKKLRQDLNTVKTNEQYSAITKMIEETKEKISRLDEEWLKNDEFRERKKQELKKIKQELDGEVNKYRHEKEAILKKIEEYKNELKNLENEKMDAMGKIPVEIKELYMKIITRTGDVAVSRVDSGVCSVCNASISPDTTSRLSTQDEVLSCYSCGRILIIL